MKGFDTKNIRIFASEFSGGAGFAQSPAPLCRQQDWAIKY